MSAENRGTTSELRIRQKRTPFKIFRRPRRDAKRTRTISHYHANLLYFKKGACNQAPARGRRILPHTTHHVKPEIKNTPRSAGGLRSAIRGRDTSNLRASSIPRLMSCCLLHDRTLILTHCSHRVNQKKSQIFPNNTFFTEFHRKKSLIRNRGLPTGDTSISQGLHTTAKKRAPSREIRPMSGYITHMLRNRPSTCRNTVVSE